MITSMFEIVCVTQRSACCGDFLKRIDSLGQCGIRNIILREKDMPKEDYRLLAKDVMKICRSHGFECTLHSFAYTARELGAQRIHLPLDILRQMSGEEKKAFRVIGASCHSVEDAREAARLGASYITAGHIFETDCKKGLAGRGLGFLQRVCESVDIPVYAIGGISPENIGEIQSSGAAGACLMSSLMKAHDIKGYIDKLKGGIHLAEKTP